jgi:hypothetical protein
MSGLRKVPQLSRADLALMTAEQIVQAHREGRLAELLGGVAPVDFASVEALEISRDAPEDPQ